MASRKRLVWVGGAIATVSLFVATRPKSVPIEELLHDIESQRVREVSITGQNIRATYRQVPSRQRIATIPKGFNIDRLLKQRNISVERPKPTNWWSVIGDLAVIIIFFVFVMAVVIIRPRVLVPFVGMSLMKAALFSVAIALCAIVIKESWFSTLAVLAGLFALALSSLGWMNRKFFRGYDPELVLHLPDVEYPSYWQLHELGSGIRARMKRATTMIAEVHSGVDATPELTVMTEAFKAEPLGEARWRLHVFLSLFNQADYPIILSDMHAHVYYSARISMPPPGSVWEWRSRIWIELKEDNSILTTGKLYEIRAHDSSAFEVTMEISRLEEKPIGRDGLAPKYKDEKNVPELNEGDGSPSKGRMWTIFGLFIDYYGSPASGEPVRWRIPTDSIFSFQDYNNGHVVYVNKANLETYRRKHKGSDGGEMLLRLFERALREHSVRVFALNKS